MSNARKWKALEDENVELTKLLAEAMLDNAILKDVAAKKMVAPEVKRNAVAHACAQHGMSKRRACPVLQVDRYRSVRPHDATIGEAITKVASERPRFGYRRIHLMLDRQGIVMNLKQLRPSLSRGEADGAQAWRSKASLGNQASVSPALTPQ